MMKFPIRNILILSAAACFCSLQAANLQVHSGSTLVVHTNLILHGGDLLLHGGATNRLESGTISGLRNVDLPEGAVLTGSGEISLTGKWQNAGAFTRPTAPGGEIIISIPVNADENNSPGFGDTDGDGYMDYSEGTGDNDSDTVPNFLDPDAQLIAAPPHSWLTGYGLATDGTAYSTDPDGDGLSNYEEYLASTSPVDPNSALVIEEFELLPNDRFAIQWQTVEERSYRLAAQTNNLPDGAFGLTVVTDQTADGTSLSVTSSVPPNTEILFLRAEVLP